MARNCKCVPLSKGPLALVLCQVRMSSVRKMGEYISVIQEEFRRNGFPIERSGKIQQVSVGLNGIETSTRDKWEYRSVDGHWSIIIFEDSFAIQTTEYDKFEDFSKKLRLAAETILCKSEQDLYGRIERIGLRYVNLVQPKTNEDFRLYLKPGLHGLDADIFDEGLQRIRFECVGKTKVGSLPGAIAIRISQNDQGACLPPDLVANAPEATKFGEKDEVVTFVDLDHHLEGMFPATADWVEEQAYLLHDMIVETFYDHVVTEKAVEIWK